MGGPVGGGVIDGGGLVEVVDARDGENGGARPGIGCAIAGDRGPGWQNHRLLRGGGPGRSAGGWWGGWNWVWVGGFFLVCWGTGVFRSPRRCCWTAACRSR